MWISSVSYVRAFKLPSCTVCSGCCRCCLCQFHGQHWTWACCTITACSWFYIWRDSSSRENRAPFAAPCSSWRSLLSATTVRGTVFFTPVETHVTEYFILEMTCFVTGMVGLLPFASRVLNHHDHVHSWLCRGEKKRKCNNNNHWIYKPDLTISLLMPYMIHDI